MTISHKTLLAALVATIVMIIAGFFFAAVSDTIVGIIGSTITLSAD